MHKLKLAVISLLVLALAGSALANNFRAADQIYVLSASSRIQGAAGAIFNQDVTITNLSTDRVVVDVAIAQGDGDNSGATSPTATKRLPVFNGNERRTIQDFAANANGLNLGATTVVNGHYIFFACRENGNCSDCTANPADCRNITVESRVLTGANCISATDGVTRPCTFGNAFKGHPWYNFASQGAPGNLDKVIISGVVNTGTRGIDGFRTNIGLINASQYSSTVLRITVFNSSGNAAGAPFDLPLGPLGRSQPGVTNLGAASFTGFGHVVIEQVSVTPTTAAAAAGCTDGCPGFFAYGVAIDNVSNDPTMLEGQFPGDITATQLSCLYPQKTPKRSVRRQ